MYFNLDNAAFGLYQIFCVQHNWLGSLGLKTQLVQIKW